MNKKLKVIFMLFIVLGVVAMVALPIWIMISLITIQTNNINLLELHEWLIATYVIATFSLFVDVYLFHKLIFTDNKKSKK